MAELRTQSIVAIVAVALSGPLCYVCTIALAAVSGGAWVGGGHIPLPWSVTLGACAPGVAYLAYGFVLAARGWGAKYPLAEAAGIVCGLVGIALFGVMGFFVAMMHIG